MTPAGRATEKITKAATGRATGLLQGVRSKARKGEPDDGTITARQTLTFHDSDVGTLQRFFEDAVILSEIAGRAATVDHAEGDRYDWRFTPPAGQDPIGVTTTLETYPGLLRWTQTGENADGHRAELRLTPAPRDLGTEVTFEVEVRPSPALPEALTQLALGGALFKALYRARALAQTSEVPTLRHNPAARNGGADHDED